MSEYFRVLRRLERDQATPAPAVRRRPAGQVRALLSAGAAARAAEEPLLRAPSPERVSAFAPLYDNLRAAASGQPLRTLVFAGASSSMGVDRVIAGLTAHVQQLGLRVLLGRLRDGEGRRELSSVAQSSEQAWSAAEPLPLDLTSHADGGAIRAWLDEHAAEADMVLLAGGSLGSVDPALLAGACDGLVIVVHAEHTARAALTAALDRAHAVKCRPLGLVVVDSRDPLPRWLRRMFPVHSAHSQVTVK